MEAGQLGLALRRWELGEGDAVLFLHESATSGEVWAPLAEQVSAGMRAISYDRRGWGGSPAPEAYTRTTVEEQAEDAAVLLEGCGVSRAILCGAGLGAVAALDLLLRRPRLVAGAVLIEPPLLAFLPDATEGLSGDRSEIEAAVERGGPAAAVDLYLEGGLPFLGPGAGRIPEPIAQAARRRPLSLFAELAAVPGWPLRPTDLIAVDAPSVIALAASSPPVLRRAGEELASRLGGSRLLRVGGEGLPAMDAPSGIAGAIESLREG